MDHQHSLPYNPLATPQSFTEIQQVAHLIVQSSESAMGGSGDGIWAAGAEKIIRILIQCLKNRGDETYINLANVKHLLDNFDAHLYRNGQSRIDQFVLESTINDEATYSDYLGFTNGNEKTMLSFLSTANTALGALGNPELSALTATNGFNFARLRQRKTVLYVLVKQQDLRFFSFLLNLFYTDLCRHLLKDLNGNHLPVYMLLDEFGHLTIPDFSVFATTARKYKVGFWLFLQSASQLVSRYGQREAETILDGLQTEIYLPGVSLDTASLLSRRLGKRQIPTRQGGVTIYREENLMNEDQIIRMKDNRILLLHSNYRPIQLQVKPFYKQFAFSQVAKIPPAILPTQVMLAPKRVPLPPSGSDPNVVPERVLTDVTGMERN